MLVWSLLAVLLGGLLASCRSTLPATGAVTPDAGTAALAPWALPQDAYPTQRLFRLQAESVEEGGALRLVLRLESPERYRLTISDRLGRTLYTVDAARGSGWLLDHREQRACRLGPDLALGGVALEAFPPAALPRVLLGRVPVRPDGRVRDLGPGHIELRDRRGHRWTVERHGSTVVGWVAWRAGRPVVWWRRVGDEALLSDRERGVQMRWRQVAREPLGEPLAPPAVPSGFLSGPCADGAHPAADLPALDAPQ